MIDALQPRRRLACVTVFSLVLAAACSLFFTARHGVETDLHALLGGSNGSRVAAVAASLRDTARFLVRAPTREAAEARVTALGVPADEPGAADPASFLASFSGGLLAERTREALRKGDFASVRAGALARLYSPAPPIVPVARDPFLLTTEYAVGFAPKDPAWHLVTRRLSPTRARDVLEALRTERAAAAPDIRVSGAPFHTAAASGRAGAEINVLGAFSLVGVIGVGFWLFGNVRFVPPLLCALAAAFIVGVAAVFALFPRPHALTFVFGTTLAGVGVDYVYHALAARGDIRRPLAAAFASTSACFAPLLISEVVVLRQMAVFTIAGLATTYAVARLLRTEPSSGVVRSRVTCDPTVWGGWRSRRMRVAIVLAAVVFAVSGLMRVRMVNGPEAFYRPDAFLAAEEKFVAEALGTASFLPPVAVQHENAALVRKLYAAVGADYCAETGFPVSVLAPPDESRFFEPREELVRMFDTCARETYRLLGCAFLALALVAFLFFRSAFAVCALPALAANLLTLAALGWIGMRVSFFHALCFFVFTGLGADYAIFLARRMEDVSPCDDTTRRTVRASFLTSVCAFALLAFTDFPVTCGMGVTLAFGLVFSYLTALFFAPLPVMPPVRSAGSAWHGAPERGAGRLRMRFMWFLYRVSGKTLPKLVACVVVACVYPFATPVRRALRAFYAALGIRAGAWRLYRHMTGFAFGLVDKIDACSGGPHPPRMTVRDDADRRALEARVRSGRGAVLLTTHLGTAEVLPALAKDIKAHAFQLLGHDSVFTRTLLEHLDASRLELHDVASVGVETIDVMRAALARGEIVLMAGDRTGGAPTRAANRLVRPFLGRNAVWPRGVFRFAEMLDAPVFAVTCVSAGWDAYETHVKALDDLFPDYVAFLEAETRARPDQWYHFHDFWSEASDETVSLSDHQQQEEEERKNQ